MATRLVGASASTAPARVARMTTATTPTQPSVWDSQDRAPTPSWEEVGPRAAAANGVLLRAFVTASCAQLLHLCVSLSGTSLQGKGRAVPTARLSNPCPVGSRLRPVRSLPTTATSMWFYRVVSNRQGDHWCRGLLGGSRVVINGAISKVTVLIAHIR